MDSGFWGTLPHPIIGLSPMDGVTDAAYRLMAAKYGRPHLVITEFTAAEGIRAGAERLLTDFIYDPIERPIAAQLFGSDPSAFVVAGAVAAALGFDGIDINMGCPAKNIAERGAGAALIRDPERAKQIVHATREGITRWANGESLLELGVPESLHTPIQERREVLNNPDRRLLPISIKTRIGYDEIVVEDWVKHLLETGPAAISVHGRTLKQMYTGEANWEAIGCAAKVIRNAGVLALGNGDIKSLADAHERIRTYGVNGVLIGRASYGNPWLFANHEATIEERLSVALEHARTHERLMQGHTFLRMRKHLLDYTKGFDGAKELRQQLMHVTSLAEVEAILLH